MRVLGTTRSSGTTYNTLMFRRAHDVRHMTVSRRANSSLIALHLFALRPRQFSLADIESFAPRNHGMPFISGFRFGFNQRRPFLSFLVLLLPPLRNLTTLLLHLDFIGVLALSWFSLLWLLPRHRRLSRSLLVADTCLHLFHRASWCGHELQERSKANL